MRAELRRIIESLDALEDSEGGRGVDPNKIDDFFRLILLGENNYIARYLSDIKETDDWMNLSDVVMALQESGFFELFPRKKWIRNMVQGSWDKALQEALRQGEEDIDVPAADSMQTDDISLDLSDDAAGNTAGDTAGDTPSDT